jgi:aspartyl-tRNA(Asn)/glutamyl-tRNA(Gln) amidotransferase subunit C
MAIERKTVEHVAKLARLQLSDAELATYQKQLGAILDYIAKLGTLDVAGLEPLAHPAETSNIFRDDTVKPCLPRTDALRNAPDRNDDFFIVPKVVE